MNKFPTGLADQETALNICLRSLASRPNIHFLGDISDLNIISHLVSRLKGFIN